MLLPLSLLWASIPVLLAPLLSIFIFAGVPFVLMALLKNHFAALSYLVAVKRKSTVRPALSIALEILPLDP